LPKHRLELARMILSEKPSYLPGTGYEYSNAGFSIGGAMLERASREEYEKLLAEHLFKPLGMDSAGFRAPGRNRKVEQPYGHRRDPKSGEQIAIDPEPRGDNPDAMAPAGLVHCSIVDLAKYARAHLGHGPAGFLSEEELANLHRPRHEGDKPYALGWSVLDQPWTNGPALMHIGSNTMWFSVIWIVPGRDFAAVTGSNTGEQEGFAKCDEAVRLLAERFLK
jgi:CubicO group peptidase (beta-lactamase class C family)